MNRPVLILALIVVAVALVAPAGASAGTYEVKSCAHAPDGANRAWVSEVQSTLVPESLEVHDACPDAVGFYGAGLQAYETPGFFLTPAGDFARWTFTAPAGTSISRLDYDRFIGKDTDEEWFVYGRVAGGTVFDTCEIPPTGFIDCQVGAPGGESKTVSGLNASKLQVGIECIPGGLCSSGSVVFRQGWAVIYGSTVTITDNGLPTVGVLSGELGVAGGQVVDGASVSVPVSDASGVASGDLSIDGVVKDSVTRSCDFGKPKPCRDADDTPGDDLPLTFSWDSGEVGVDSRDVTVRIRARDAAGNERTVTHTARVVRRPYVLAGQEPQVSGIPAVGQQLSCSTGGWANEIDATAVRWLRGGTEVGAGATYVVQSADRAQSVRCEVRQTNAAGTGTAQSATVTAIGPPVNQTLPTIAGTAKEGRTLTAATGVWDDGGAAPSLTRQWQRCDTAGEQCAEIAGETGSSYVAQAGDVGHTLRVQVRAANVAGEGEALSAPTAVIASGRPVSTAPPKIVGVPRVNDELTADVGVWQDAEQTTVAWFACVTIDCAARESRGHGTTFTPTTQDLTRPLVLVVTASNEFGSQIAESAPSTLVQPAGLPLSLQLPSLDTAQPHVGVPITADPGQWSGADELIVNWERCKPAGCVQLTTVGETYTPTASDVGAHLQVAVTARNESGDTVRRSPASSPVRWGAPVALTAVAVEGEAVVGEVLSGSGPQWGGDPTVEQWWERCSGAGGQCREIAGSRASDAHTLVAGDVGRRLRFVVRATNDFGTEVARSSLSAVVSERPEPVDPPPPVTPPPPPVTPTPPPVGPSPPDGGPGPGSPVVPPGQRPAAEPPPPGPSPPPAQRRAVRLTATVVARGRSWVLSGRVVPARASGLVQVSYRFRTRGRTRAVRRTVHLRQGRYRVTVRHPVGSVTVRYAGDRLHRSARQVVTRKAFRR